MTESTTNNNKMKLIFGAAGFLTFSDDQIQEIFKILKNHNVKNLDTAHIYPQSEEILGRVNASSDFIIDSKAPGFKPGALEKESVSKAASQSHQFLKEIETYYLHSPDHQTPLEETLATINSLYQHGVFKKFGLSNFTPEEVQKIYDIAKANNYVLPTVYQGNYNAVARLQENTLFPVLRRLGIQFYAYSPIAGGFLAKKAEVFSEGQLAGQGRFDPASPVSKLYNKLYNKPVLLKALSQFHTVAEQNSITSPELAYRWIVYHSSLDPTKGDGVIIGASRPAQLEQTLQWIEKGPLDAEVVKGVEEVWGIAKDGGVIDNFYSNL